MTSPILSRLFGLQGRVALVTGGSRGLGFAIAQGLLELGATVYLCSRKSEACESAAASLAPYGTCRAVAADVSSEEGIAKLVQVLSSAEASLDILVNNAGAAWAEPFDTFPAKGWDKVMDLNLRSPFFLTQALAPMLRKAARRRPAKVINIASIDGLSVNPQETYSYAASKAGLVHLTRRLALRLVEDNVIVNGIAPGMFPSDMNRRARDEGDALAASIPARRLGGPDDIAAAAIYLAGASGDYLLGETLVVDGGLNWYRTA